MDAEIRIPEDVLSRELDGEAVLLDLRSGRYFGLNATGARVWASLRDGVTDRAALAAALVEEFEVTPEQARADVDGFLSSLADRGLVRLASARV